MRCFALDGTVVLHLLRFDVEMLRINALSLLFMFLVPEVPSGGLIARRLLLHNEMSFPIPTTSGTEELFVKKSK